MDFVVSGTINSRLTEAFSVRVEEMNHAGWAGGFEFEGK